MSLRVDMILNAIGFWENVCSDLLILLNCGRIFSTEKTQVRHFGGCYTGWGFTGKENLNIDRSKQLEWISAILDKT